MTYRCLCCEYEATFATAKEAFDAGWDVAPYFSVEPVCNLCPSAPIAMCGVAAARLRHEMLHDQWARQGRPVEFDVEAEVKLDGGSPAVVKTRIDQLKAATSLEELVALLRAGRGH